MLNQKFRVSCMVMGVLVQGGLISGSFTSENPNVYLQAFNWTALSSRNYLFSTVAAMAQDIALTKIDGVWLPPASESVDAQGYMPTRWFRFVSDEVQSAVSAINGVGLEAIADVVVNHRSAPSIHPCSNTYIAFEEPSMGPESVVANDWMCGSSSNAFCPANSCTCGAYDTGDNFCGSPDLDHTNAGVQAAVAEYLQFLKQAGYSGWRFDMAKGYGGQYVGQYVKGSSPSFAVGEYWDTNPSNVASWTNAAGQASTAFDFPFRASLKYAISSDSYSGVKFAGMMSVNSGLASTFLDNHDTSRNDRFGGDRENLMGYAVILTHPGVPFIYWDDYLNSNIKTQIAHLVSLRKEAGITSTSRFYVSQATGGVYSAWIFGSNLTIACKIGRGNWSPSGQMWSLRQFGDSFAVWSISASSNFQPY